MPTEACSRCGAVGIFSNHIAYPGHIQSLTKHEDGSVESKSEIVQTWCVAYLCESCQTKLINFINGENPE